jgi:hypothetical protein
MSSSAPSPDVLHLKIADIGVALEIPDPDKRAAVHERYREFIVSGVVPEMTIRVEVRDGARFVPLRSGPWVIELKDDGGRLNYRSHFDAGWADVERGSGFVELAPEADIENFLRVVYARLCLRAGGLLVHAAGVVSERAGFVFFGPSGSGKTTAARLSLDHTVLSDDLIILMKQNGVTRVYGVPFRGDFPEAPRVNLSANLRGLFSLVKAPEHRVGTIPAPEGAARLLASAPFVMTDAARARHAIDVCLRITEDVPVQALYFRPDPAFWEKLHEC